MMDPLFVNILGWTGAAAYLVAYTLVSIRKVEGDSILYQSLNLAGGILLATNALYYAALPSVGVNLAWIGIALFALGRKILGNGSCRKG